MTLVEILDVVLSDLDTERLRGRNIEAPKTGKKVDSDAFYVVGWGLGRSSPAVTVEVVHNGKVLQSAPMDVQRPDIADAFPDASGAEQSGFRTNVPVPDSEEFELLVRAVLQDESTASLGSIQGRQDGIGESTESGSSVQGPSGPKVEERSSASEGFFRRLFGRGGG